MNKKVYVVLGTTLLSAAVASSLVATVASSHNTGAARDNTITLRIGTWEGQGTSLTDQHTIANNYMKAHPNVKIQIESVPDNYTTKMLTEVAAGAAPDIFQIGDGDISMFASRHAIIDLDPNVKAAGINLSAFYPTVLDTGKVDGHLYTMPKDWSNLAVYYNKKLFDKAHVPYPKANWTWAQLQQVAQKLTLKKGGKVTQWGVQLPGDWNRAIEPLIEAYGGQVISPKGTYQGYLNSPAVTKALTFYRGMYMSGIAPSPADVKGFQGVDLFQTGKVAMSVTGDWPVLNYNHTPGLSYSTVQLPQGPKGAANAICYAGWGISSQSANQQAAWDYLKYLSGVPGEQVLSNYAFVSMKTLTHTTGQDKNRILKAFIDGIPAIKKLPESVSPYFSSTGGQQVTNVLDTILMPKAVNVQSVLNAAAKTADSQTSQDKAQAGK